MRFVESSATIGSVSVSVVLLCVGTVQAAFVSWSPVIQRDETNQPGEVEEQALALLCSRELAPGWLPGRPPWSSSNGQFVGIWVICRAATFLGGQYTRDTMTREDIYLCGVMTPFLLFFAGGWYCTMFWAL